MQGNFKHKIYDKETSITIIWAEESPHNLGRVTRKMVFRDRWCRRCFDRTRWLSEISWILEQTRTTSKRGRKWNGDKLSRFQTSGSWWQNATHGCGWYWAVVSSYSVDTVVKMAREQLEAKIGKSVISHRNAKDFLRLPEECKWRIFNSQLSTFNYRNPCLYVTSVGNIFFSHGSHGLSRIWLNVIRAHLWHQWEISFFKRICFLGSLLCVRDWSGILWERSLRSEQRYSGKPDGDSRNAHINS